MAGLCSCGDWFEYGFVGNTEDRFSRVVAYYDPYNTSNQNNSGICQQFSINQLIKEPTHFTEQAFFNYMPVLRPIKNHTFKEGMGPNCE